MYIYVYDVFLFLQCGGSFGRCCYGRWDCRGVTGGFAGGAGAAGGSAAGVILCKRLSYFNHVKHTHIHTHTHTHAHTHIHSHTHTLTHSLTHTDTHTLSHIHTRIQGGLQDLRLGLLAAHSLPSLCKRNF